MSGYNYSKIEEVTADHRQATVNNVTLLSEKKTDPKQRKCRDVVEECSYRFMSRDFESTQTYLLI